MTGQELLSAARAETTGGKEAPKTALWKRLAEEKLTGLADTAAPVLEHAVATFGSSVKALDWLNSECGALRNRIPVELLRENQAELVDEELSRIDHGAYV